MKTGRLCLGVWFLVVSAEIISAAIFGTGIRVPAFAGLAWAIIFGLASIWAPFNKELIAAATAVTIISVIAGITGHTSGGGLLLFSCQLILCCWGCARIWKDRYDVLLISMFFPLFTLGVIIDNFS